MTRRYMPVALEKFQTKEGGGFRPWAYEGKHGPSVKTLPLHFIFNKDVFSHTMGAYLGQSDQGFNLVYDSWDAIVDIGESFQNMGPDAFSVAPNSILSHVGAAFGTPYAVQYSLESIWRYMGRNILEVDPLLMEALMRTQVNILPEDFQLPISPLYVALPPGTLSIENQDDPGQQVDIDGFMAQVIDYEKMPGEIFTFHELIEKISAENNIDHYSARGQILQSGLNPGDSVYVDDYVGAVGDVALRDGYTRHLRINAYSSTPAGVAPSHVQFMYFIIPLDMPVPVEAYLGEYDFKLKTLLTASDSPQTPQEWGRAIFNPLLYFFSQGADKKRELGLTTGQQKRLSKITSKKQRQQFIEKHKSPFSIIKLGASFSPSLPSGSKRDSIDKRFVVRGHWRMQRVGKGLKDIKTIWIQPYVKGTQGESSDTARVYRNPY